MAGRRVVVTGIGTINPLGKSIEEYFSNLEKGVSAAATITHFDATKFRSRIACEVKDYDWSQYFDRKEVRKYDLFAQWAMISADQAISDAALVDNEQIDLERVGVVWGSGIGGVTTFFEESKGFVEGGYTPRSSPFFVPRMVIDLVAGHISIKYGYLGPNYATTSACASSNHAMIDALDLIRLGRADVVITGGSEAAINEPGVGSFCSMQAL
jgi:3-oxoacyl-[acyl-carrier-protein] synthase II